MTMLYVEEMHIFFIVYLSSIWETILKDFRNSSRDNTNS